MMNDATWVSQTLSEAKAEQQPRRLASEQNTGNRKVAYAERVSLESCG